MKILSLVLVSAAVTLYVLLVGIALTGCGSTAVADPKTCGSAGSVTYSDCDQYYSGGDRCLSACYFPPGDGGGYGEPVRAGCTVDLGGSTGICLDSCSDCH